MVIAVLVALSTLAATTVAGAQPPAGAGGGQPVPRTIRGQVITPGADAGPAPTRGVWVTLHRVAPGDAGPVDSARTDAAGRYTIAYRRAPSDSAVFFLSAAHAGITYFSAPIADGHVSGEEAELVVYDTASVTEPLPVHGRHVIVGMIDSTGRHPVVEVYEVVNDGTVTYVGSEERPTFATRVPEGAQDFRLTSGDISPDAVTVSEGMFRISAPIPPGTKQVGFAYMLPPSSFPLSLPVERDLDELEVLLEDSAATVDGARLSEVESVPGEGRPFRRFVAEGVPASAVFRITVPEPRRSMTGVYVAGVLVVVGLVMLAALGRTMRRPAPTPLGWNGATGPGSDELARRIAALDASFQRRRNPSPEERGEYERTRGGLKAMLADAIAREGDQRR
ncbi:MAG TPA: hypothetical protein VGE02_10650 [Gemmatimonadales bacterium]